MEDHTRISVQNRGHILDAAFAMQQSNRMDFNLCRKIYSYLKKESEYLPWSIAMYAMAAFKNIKSLEPWIISLLEPALKNLGYTTRREDKADQISLRFALMTLACQMSIQKCMTEAEQKFKRWKQSEDPDGEIPVDPDYQPILIGFGIFSGKTNEEIDENKKFVLRRIEKEKQNIWDLQYVRLRSAMFIYENHVEELKVKDMSILLR